MNDDQQQQTIEAPARGISHLTAGDAGAVALDRHGQLRWCRAFNADNVFDGTIDLPRGVKAGDVVSLSIDRVTISVVTRGGAVHVYSSNAKTWIATGQLFEEGR